jgi:hypothetical protein
MATKRLNIENTTDVNGGTGLVQRLPRWLISMDTDAESLANDGHRFTLA